MTLTNATLVEDDEAFYFVSLDGELFLGVSRLAEPGDEEAVRKLMEGDSNFRPMLIHRRLLSLRHGASVTFETVEAS